MTFQRMDGMRFTPYLQDMVTAMAQSTVPSDATIIHLVKVQQLVNDISDTFPVSETALRPGVPIWRAPISMQIKVFTHSLADLDSSVTVDGIQGRSRPRCFQNASPRSNVGDRDRTQDAHPRCQYLSP